MQIASASYGALNQALPQLSARPSQQTAPLFGKINADVLQFSASLPVSSHQLNVTPREISNEVKKYVMHQDKAVDEISLAVFEHINRVLESRVDAAEKEALENPRLTGDMLLEELSQYFWAGNALADDHLSYEGALKKVANGFASLISGNIESGTEVSAAQVNLMKQTMMGLINDQIIGLHEPYNSGISDTGGAHSVEVIVEQAIRNTIAEANTNYGAVVSRKNQIEVHQDVLAEMRATLLRGGSLNKPNALDAVDFSLASSKDTELGKSNILMIGETGSGKTHIARQFYKVISQYLDVPFVKFNAGNLTAPGYIGGNIEEIGQLLMEQSGGDTEKAQNGIVFLDEIDKKRKKGTGRDVSGEDAQDNLLTLLEDGQFSFKYNDKMVTLSTENILFITAGAFSGLEDIIRKRLGISEKGGIGFNSDLEPPKFTRAELLQHVTADDLVAYGMKPEFVGRLPFHAVLQPSTVEGLKSILTEPADALVKKHINHLRGYGIKLTFSDRALTKIAEKAMDMGTGARALQSLMDDATKVIRFQAPEMQEGTTVSVTEKTVENPKKFQVRKPKTAPQFGQLLSLFA